MMVSLKYADKQVISKPCNNKKRVMFSTHNPFELNNAYIMSASERKNEFLIIIVSI